MSAMPAGEGRSAQVPGETAATVPTRRARLRAAAAARGVPLPAILVTVAVVVPAAGALQVIARELWQATAWPGPPDGEPPADPEPAPLGSGQVAL